MAGIEEFAGGEHGPSIIQMTYVNLYSTYSLRFTTNYFGDSFILGSRSTIWYCPHIYMRRLLQRTAYTLYRIAEVTNTVTSGQAKCALFNGVAHLRLQ